MLSKVYWLQAIKRAHEDVKPGLLQVNAGELLNASANRSPTAYLANPPGERARYQHNTDKTMTLLKVLDTEERQAPAFAVCRVSCMERALQPDHQPPYSRPCNAARPCLASSTSLKYQTSLPGA